MNVAYRLLIVDDDPFIRRVLRDLFVKQAFEVVTVESAEAAQERIEVDPYDAVLTDYTLPAMDGITFCQWMAEHHPATPVVLMTANASLDAAVLALRAGSIDFLRKPLSPSETVIRLTRVLETQRLRGQLQRLEASVGGGLAPGPLIGECPEILRLRALLGRVRGSHASVLIAGETGTGKEVVARMLHDNGPRARGPFIALNCAAVPENLFESELFGHVRGAFTDARSDHTGLMAQASGGTLFLDEFGELPLSLQPKLLRALEEREVRPVGGTRSVPIDVRVIAATNADLEAQIAEGRFREDLYFRVAVVPVRVPPLRSRGNDILLLAQHFLGHFARVAGKDIGAMHHEVGRRLLAYPWPGNVRELRNAVEHAVALALHATLEPGDLPERVARHQSSHVVVVSDNPDELPSLLEVERRYIQRVLTIVAGNKSQAARILHLDRATLYRKLERLKLPTD